MTNEADRRPAAPAPPAAVRPLVLEGGGVTCRVRTWPHRADTASLGLYQQSRLPAGSDLDRWSEQLRAAGFDRVRTSALSSPAVTLFEQHGYLPVQELVLLQHDDPRAATEPATRTQRLEHHSFERAAQVDTEAFGEEWGLDAAAVADVCTATPRHRARAIGDAVDGYAITGRDNRLGFLQRLAVAPAAQRHGIGRALVLDSLGWLGRWRVQRVLVNTPAANEAALALYEGAGFHRLAERLWVCEAVL
jgi:ribosomal protein S18 acetylase RimI-like enzyme